MKRRVLTLSSSMARPRNTKLLRACTKHSARSMAHFRGKQKFREAVIFISVVVTTFATVLRPSLVVAAKPII